MISQVVLPKGYTKLDFVMNTELNPLIDTGVLADNNLGVYIDYELVSITANNNTFGAISSNSGYKRHHFMVNNGNVSYYYNTTSYSFGAADLLRHKLFIDPEKHVILYDNTSRTLSETTFNTQLNYGLFGRTTTNSSLQYSFKGKIYECKLFTSGTLVRWFIPCKNSLNVCGLYDICTCTFYSANDSSVTLQPGTEALLNNLKNCYIRGNNVCRIVCNDNILWGLPEGYTKLPYITNPSTAYINTNVNASSDLRLDITFSINNLQTGTQTYPIFGGRQTTTTKVFARLVYS